jgi:hypothetical protein
VLTEHGGAVLPTKVWEPIKIKGDNPKYKTYPNPRLAGGGGLAPGFHVISPPEREENDRQRHEDRGDDWRLWRQGEGSK